MTTDRLQLVRDSYTAYETGDRDLIERVIADDFVFSAPPDVGIDRATYFERCWPNAGHVATFEYVRLRETGRVIAAQIVGAAPPDPPVTAAEYWPGDPERAWRLGHVSFVPPELD